MNDREWLAAIVDATDDAIVSATLADGLIASWNHGAQRLFGYTAAEAVGKPITMLAPTESYVQISRTVSLLRSGAVVPPYEAVRLRKDGIPLTVSITLAPMQDPAGEVVGAGAIIRDISEQVRVRQALEAQKERLVLSQRVAQVGSWEWDVASGLVTWSDELYRMYGVDPRSFQPSFETFVGCLHPEDRAAVIAEIAAAVEQRRGYAIEHRIRRPDGSVRAMSARAEVMLGDELQVVRVYGTSQDVTEARALQSELRRQKETLELVGRATNDLVWDWDLVTGRVERGQGLEAYGYTAADAADAPNSWWVSLVHPDDLARVEASLAQARESDATTWSERLRVRRADGSYAQIIDRGYFVRDATGRAVRMVGSTLDVTERERAQELARRGAASAELLARASHELRTPLNAILGFSDLLEQRLDATLGPRERRYLQNIRGSGQHLLQLIDRLLQIAKADSGRLELHPSVIPIFGLAAPVYAEFAAAAAAAQVSLDLELPEASIRVDLERMSIVLRELVANALAATPAGGSVVVRATIPDDDLVLEVIDSGRGIPEDARSRVFEVFQQFHDDREGGHTGLGLALCRELVEAHGGTISFESEPGRRTAFRIHLPHVAWVQQHGDRVLIVDDQPNDADLAMTVARDAGHRCEVVGTVAEARAAVIRDVPIAVILDLHLPDGTGLEVLELLRSLAPAVPVLVISAYDAEYETPHGTARLTKPIDPTELAAWLGRVAGPKVAA